MSETCTKCGQSLPREPFGPWYNARKAKGWSVREAAKEAGISPATVNRADHGHEMKASAAVALAGAYGVTVEAMHAKDPFIGEAS